MAIRISMTTTWPLTMGILVVSTVSCLKTNCKPSSRVSVGVAVVDRGIGARLQSSFVVACSKQRRGNDNVSFLGRPDQAVASYGVASFVKCSKYATLRAFSSRCISLSATASPNSSFRVKVDDPEQMEALGASIWETSSLPGDVILLGGDLGAGKTSFSRGYVRAATQQRDLRVTSPTYLLSNAYPVQMSVPESFLWEYEEDDEESEADDDHEEGQQDLDINVTNEQHENDEEVNSSDDEMTNIGTEVHHMDLYRLPGVQIPDELEPLDLKRVFSSCMALIEWPDMLLHPTSPYCTQLEAHSLRVHLRILPSQTKAKVEESKESEDHGGIEAVPRVVEFEARGGVWKRRLQDLFHSVDEEGAAKFELVTDESPVES